ncbi:MAG: type II secretion system minor pseudopilin GspK [Endozoicomonas sp.]
MKRQQGIALLSVVLITAAMTLALTLFGEQIQRDAHRQKNLRLYQQSWWYADSAEQIVAYSLKELNKEKTTHLNQPWAIGEQVYPVEGGSVSGALSDMRACFNLNSLVSGSEEGKAHPVAVKQFRSLLENLSVEELDPELLLSRTLDWLDADYEENSIDGAEDRDYLEQEPGYYTANSLLASADELLSTGVVNRKQMTEILPFVCATPDNSGKVNINTLNEDKAPLLAALLFNRIDESTASSIIDDRPEQGFNSAKDFLDLPELKDLPWTTDERKYLNRQLAVKSDVFLASIKISFHDLTLSLESLFLIDGKEVYRVRRILGET